MPHGGMPACGVAPGPEWLVGVGPVDGIVDESTQSGVQGVGGAVSGADRPGKAKILDELCAVTGWHRDHARKALRKALVPRVVRPRAPRPPLYGEPVMMALRFCWARRRASDWRRCWVSWWRCCPGWAS